MLRSTLAATGFCFGGSITAAGAGAVFDLGACVRAAGKMDGTGGGGSGRAGGRTDADLRPQDD